MLNFTNNFLKKKKKQSILKRHVLFLMLTKLIGKYKH
jgi:hypothetical protein